MNANINIEKTKEGRKEGKEKEGRKERRKQGSVTHTPYPKMDK